ncbi:AMP-binding protein [Alteribacillus sp. JSM 102045]|uniref:AMP-binding protein n=1 Tax=Alteribacillus sp. JSM 102045 TaxID=1562101 RepID=UPI0035BF5755
MTEDAVWFPDESFKKSTRLYQWMQQLGYKEYENFLEDSTKDISWFWHEAEKVLGVEWFAPYKKTLDLSKGIQWPKWFVDGKLNACCNAVHTWTKQRETSNSPALKWEGEDGEVIQFTFSQLKKEIDQTAAGLKEIGVQKGDVVTLYMPMIPETVIAMMAVTKLGAVFSPTFSGYGAEAVATRMNASKTKVLITADGFLRRGKKVQMKKEADRAASLTPSLEKMVVVNRLNIDSNWNETRDISWKNLMSLSSVNTKMEEMESSDTLMLIYTSGTTGKPKGAVHTHSGFPLKAAFDAGIGMDVKKGDTLFWFTDMGWMMGPFLVYGALINGACILMYEGTPDFPEPDRLWKLVDKHEVTHLGISPTLIRSLMKHGEQFVNEFSMSNLRVIASTGEPWNPEPWKWLFKTAGKNKTPIFNYSGGTEIAGGILGNVLVKPIGPVTFNSAIPGMAAEVFNEKGEPAVGEVGELVITKPWVGMTNGFWNEPDRYEETYWKRWENIWVHGDWAVKDEKGYWTITGRSDDILNIAGKRLGPAEMESVLVEHPAVREAGTIGVPHDVKGEEAVCFVILNDEYNYSKKLEEELIAQCGLKLGKALRPSSIFTVYDLPKTRNAKVMRRAIKAAFLNKDPGDLSSLENPEAIETIKEIRNKQRSLL